MPQLIVLYEIADDGRPVPLLSSGDADVLRSVAKLFADKLGIAVPPRVLELARPRAGGEPS